MMEDINVNLLPDLEEGMDLENLSPSAQAFVSSFSLRDSPNHETQTIEQESLYVSEWEVIEDGDFLNNAWINPALLTSSCPSNVESDLLETEDIALSYSALATPSSVLPVEEPLDDCKAKTVKEDENSQKEDLEEPENTFSRLESDKQQDTNLDCYALNVETTSVKRCRGRPPKLQEIDEGLRRWKNKEASRKSRQKKKNKTAALEESAKQLSEKNKQLRGEVSVLEAELAYLLQVKESVKNLIRTQDCEQL